jgi:peptide/nickel transport system substrate-binding protein
MNSKNRLGKVLIVSVITAVLLLNLTPSPRVFAATGETFSKWGPKLDYVLVKIYGSYEAEAADFLNGQIDMMDWPLDWTTYNTIKSDSNFVLKPLTMYDMYDIDINNLRWPTSDVNFRRALAYLIDYETFYTTVLRAYTGTLMDSIIWSEWPDWYNPSATKYYFNETLALDILTAAGYWWDGGVMKYTNSSGTFDVPPIDFYAREDDPLRHSLGDIINDELTYIGIPTNYYVASYEICSQHAYENYDYNLYTAGAGPFTNPLFLYDYYSSQFGVGWLPEPWAPNSVFFTNATYDEWAAKLKEAPDKPSAVEACMKCQEIFMDQIPAIPVYHSAGSTAYRAKYGHWPGEEAYWDMNWTGIVNSKYAITTAGVNDEWTLFNAHPAGVKEGGVLRYGTMNDAIVVNPVMQYWLWDGIILSTIYDTLVRFDPYSGVLLPSLASSWSIDVWDNGGENATVVTFKLCKGVKWNDGTSFNSTDVAFTMKYMFDAGSPLFYSGVERIMNITEATPYIETPDAYTVKIYFDLESMWALQLVGMIPIIPKHVWESIPPEDCEAQGEYVATGNLTGTGPYEIVSHTEGENWVLRARPNYFMRTIGDIGSRVGSPPSAQFFAYDQKVDGTDLALFLVCFKNAAPPGAIYPCDIGSRVGSPPSAQFFAYDQKVDGTDLALFLLCFKGLGP